MNKYKLNIGTKVNFTEAFDNTQNLAYENLLVRFNSLLKVKGVLSLATPVTAYDADTIIIPANTYFFENGEVVKINAAISKNTTDFVLTPGTTYVLIIKYKTAGSQSVSALNGFYYDSGDSPSTVKYTVFTDSYELKVKEWIGISYESDEIPLCHFMAAPNNTINLEAIFEDLRPQLFFNDMVLDPSAVVLRDSPVSVESLSLNNKWIFTTSSNEIHLKPLVDNKIFKIQNLNNTDLISIDTATGDMIFTINTNLNPTSKFTFNGNVKINGTLYVGNLPVVLEDSSIVAPPAPLDVRIVDITSTHVGSYLSVTDKIAIKLEWGYNDITGYGEDDGYFYINNAIYKANNYFLNNKFEDYYLWIPSLNESFLIEDSAATINNKTQLRVKSLVDGSYPDLSSVLISLSASDKAIIHSNAVYYHVIFIPVVNDLPDPKNASLIPVNLAFSPTKQFATYECIPNKKYIIKVYAYNAKSQSSVTEMGEGSFNKFGVTQFYSNIFQANHPAIPTEGASLMISSVGISNTASEIYCTITGFPNADYFEWILGAPEDFNSINREVHKIISRKFDFTSTQTGNITVSVRACIGGQAVSAPLSTTLTLGNNSSIITDIPWRAEAVSLNTISATLTKISANEATLSAMYSPADTTNSIETPLSSIVGDILIDSADHEYIINSVYATTTAGMWKVTLSAGPSNTGNIVSTAGPCHIGTKNKRSRLITNIPVSGKLKITKIAFDLDSIYTLASPSDYITLRIYKKGNDADSRILNIRPGTDNIIFSDWGSQGALVIDGSINSTAISVDLYSDEDPTFANINKNGVLGTLYIYGNYDTTAKQVAVHQQTMAIE